MALSDLCITNMFLTEWLDDSIEMEIIADLQEEKETQSMYLALTALSKEMPRDWKPRVAGFAEEVVPHFNEMDFKTHFRISKVRAEELSELLVQHAGTKGQRGKVPVTPYKQMLIFSFYMGNAHSIEQIAILFGQAESTIHSLIHESVDILFHNYRDTFIKWPTGTDAVTVIDGFEAKQGLKGVIGATDGSHVPIAAPLESPEDYINR